MPFSCADAFKDLDREELVSYVEFLLHHYRVVDAFWFLNVEQEYGHEQACLFNEKVWAKATELAVADLRDRFKPGRGLTGLVKALGLWPWTILVDYRIEEKEDQVLISVPRCPPQEARLERGLGEYDCRGMHAAEFESFIRQIDERIRVECLFAPPGDHPKDCFCQWRFTLDRG